MVTILVLKSKPSTISTVHLSEELLMSLPSCKALAIEFDEKVRYSSEERERRDKLALDCHAAQVSYIKKHGMDSTGITIKPSILNEN